MVKNKIRKSLLKQGQLFCQNDIEELNSQIQKNVLKEIDIESSKNTLLYFQYKNEIPTHMVDHIEKNVVLWQTSNNSADQIKKLNSLFATGTDFHILIMNVEALSYPKATEFARRFLNSHKAMMAIDESTTIKVSKRQATFCWTGI